MKKQQHLRIAMGSISKYLAKGCVCCAGQVKFRTELELSSHEPAGNMHRITLVKCGEDIIEFRKISLTTTDRLHKVTG